MNSIYPKNQEGIVFSKLLRNRNQVCKEDIPTELQNEFVEEIFPDNVLSVCAQELHISRKFGTSSRDDFISEFVRRSMSKKRFGVRLASSGVDLKVVISKLIQGI